MKLYSTISNRNHTTATPARTAPDTFLSFHSNKSATAFRIYHFWYNEENNVHMYIYVCMCVYNLPFPPPRASWIGLPAPKSFTLVLVPWWWESIILNQGGVYN